MTEASEEDEEYATRPRDQRQRRRRRGLDDWTEESTTMADASKEEDEHEDYNKYNICFGGGYTARTRD